MPRPALLVVLLIALPLLGLALLWQPTTQGAVAATSGQGTLVDVKTAAHFDESPPLRTLRSTAPAAPSLAMLLDAPSGYEGPLGPQSADSAVQPDVGALPPPMLRRSFDTLPNIAGVVPPDPVGDVGPDHYVTMSNLYFAIYIKTGELLYGPQPNNTLWQGFGGPCEAENAGDPIVLYDQIDDRWILSQFTVLGAEYFNCVAVSTSGDPTGSYYRYAFSNGTVLPDYPKYGLWSDGLYISTRDFLGTFVTSIGLYAIDRPALMSGDPNATLIHFAIPVDGNEATLGDGLLPADLDGNMLPPDGSPQWFVGTMDDGGPYAAPQDALSLWRFAANFAEPAASSVSLQAVIPTTAFDSIFPCSPGPRNCIPQPETDQKVDVQSYRQRPLWRLAYRNFGTHESLVTAQSVEAAQGMAGMRWYELRDPSGTPTIHQQGTYAPGLVDGVHRWFGSAAMDQEGNLALGYSASSESLYPSLRYTGRLVDDPLGTLPRGEGIIVAGGGSQTGASRWGDYSALTVDPTDDCTFWYTNQYYPTSSAQGWQLRVGSFRFDQCGEPDFALEVVPDALSACVGQAITAQVPIERFRGFADPVTLSAAGLPPGVDAAFAPNPVVPPGTSELTLTVAPDAAASVTTVQVVGTAPTRSHSAALDLAIYSATPAPPMLRSPLDGAVAQPRQNLVLRWQPVAQAARYTVEVATDADFSDLVYRATINGYSATLDPLAPQTTYFWRVRAVNDCGTGPWSVARHFTTEATPTILLIDDDDNNPDMRPRYEAALAARNVSWDLWDTANSDNEPGAGDLAPYRVVIWFTGDSFSIATGPNHESEAALAAWLDAPPHGCLLMSSQEYHFMRGLTPFMQNYLGAASVQNDSGDYEAVVGQGAFAGASYTLDYPFTDFSDTVEPGSGAVSFIGDNQHNAALATLGEGWRTTFWLFPWEAIDSADARADALARLLAWCNGEPTAIGLTAPSVGGASPAPRWPLGLALLSVAGAWFWVRRKQRRAL
ncbi:MAG: fibronectin type III domain-containing protein [Anaerolineales bacterium]|nr:fibronectin type III domain-containing protein [Anaerolineales bacterium]MCB9128158.1 fibronectin type III domain-containing protein [Ardenticatenales bacterium]MCB9171867.1 fibronectin type III domain-containing protein [Ardenticatenales bacterium]